MNKGGQFFLIAAIVAVGALFGLTAALNTVVAGSSQKPFYSLSNEIGFETKRVIDYGVYYDQNTETLIEDFLLKYKDYIADEKALFIFGDWQGNLRGLHFTNAGAGGLGVSAGGLPGTIQVDLSLATEATVEPCPDGSGHVCVSIEGIDAVYEFDPQPGQNFFFVIVKEENDERFVATG